MSRCQKCRFQFPSDEPWPTLCPRCGAQPPSDDDDGQWVSIARLADLAEVGYFADVLESHDIQTRVRQHNEFSAVDGSWNAVFVLQVPPECGSEAAKQLREVLERTTDEAGESDRDEAPVDALPTDNGNDAGGTALWKPAVFVLIAGSLFYTTRHVIRADLKKPPKSSALWDALVERDRDLTSETRAGQPGSRLVIDRRSRTILMHEDFDGDGRSDRVRCFRDGALVGELNR